MTRADVLLSLADRAAHGSEAIFVDADEVADWPPGLLEELLETDVVRPAQPANVVACEDCWDDHVESVEFVEWPPGSEPRACIVCPTVGRVAVDPNRLRRWLVVAAAPIPELAKDTGSVETSRPRRGRPTKASLKADEAVAARRAKYLRGQGIYWTVILKDPRIRGLVKDVSTLKRWIVLLPADGD